MILIAKPSKPSLITYFGIISSVVGFYFAFSDVKLATVCLFVCAIFDFFDGRFARTFKRSEDEKKFGIIIDSLADVLAFVALPCAILFAICGNYIFAIIIAILYALCGITRLTVFTAEADPNKKTKYYRGLPITVAGFLIPIIYLVFNLLASRLICCVLCVTYVILAILFVLNIRTQTSHHKSSKQSSVNRH